MPIKDDKEMSKWLTGFIDWAVKAIIVALLTLVYNIDKKLDSQNTEISNLKAEVAIIKSEMVKWDVLTRMERTLGLLAATGRGNQAMAAVAEVLKTERESRDFKK